MRHLILLVCLFSSALSFRIDAYKNIEPYILEDVINSTIEGIRPNIPEPIEIANFSAVLPDDPDSVVKGNASISNLYLSGIQGFQITALNLEILGFKLNFTVNIPALELRSDYDLDLSLAEILGIYGNGNISVQLNETQLEASVQVNLTGGVSLYNLRVQLHLGTANFEIHGLLDDEELSGLVSGVLNDLVAKLIDENQELVTEIISPIIEIVINSVLETILQGTTAAPEAFTVGLN